VEGAILELTVTIAIIKVQALLMCCCRCMAVLWANGGVGDPQEEGAAFRKFLVGNERIVRQSVIFSQLTGGIMENFPKYLHQRVTKFHT